MIKMYVPYNDILDIINYYKKDLNTPQQSTRIPSKLEYYIVFKLEEYLEDYYDEIYNLPMLHYKVAYRFKTLGYVKGKNIVQILLYILKKERYIFDDYLQLLNSNDDMFNKYRIKISGKIIDYFDLILFILDTFKTKGSYIKIMDDSVYKTINNTNTILAQRYINRILFLFDNIYSIDNFVVNHLPNNDEPTTNKFIFSSDNNNTESSFINEEELINNIDKRLHHISVCESCKYRHQLIIFTKILSLVNDYFKLDYYTDDSINMELLCTIPFDIFHKYILNNYSDLKMDFYFIDKSDFELFMDEEYPSIKSPNIFQEFFSTFNYDEYIKKDLMCIRNQTTTTSNNATD